MASEGGADVQIDTRVEQNRLHSLRKEADAHRSQASTAGILSGEQTLKDVSAQLDKALKGTQQVVASRPEVSPLTAPIAPERPVTPVVETPSSIAANEALSKQFVQETAARRKTKEQYRNRINAVKQKFAFGMQSINKPPQEKPVATTPGLQDPPFKIGLNPDGRDMSVQRGTSLLFKPEEVRTATNITPGTQEAAIRQSVAERLSKFFSRARIPSKKS
jgi:hypothetical protein